MFISIIRYLQGYLCIRITGYSPERFLNLCSHHKIYIWGLVPQPDCYEMFITVKGFRKLKPIIKKTRTKVTITRRFGLPFFLHKYRKRKIFFGGAFFCVLMIYVMSLFIWNIHIEGNFSRTDETILEFLQSRHVRHGMKKSKVNCSRIVKDIRKEYDDVIWVSAYVTGTRLMIKIKENTDTLPAETVIDDTPCDIVAEKDGLITEIITRRGIPLVKPGDSVKAGDILVSGTIEVKNDAGEVVNYHEQHSDADIFAETSISYEDEIPFLYFEKQYTNARKYLFYFKIGTLICSVGSLKNDYKESELLSKEKQLKLGEHFYLPISVGSKVMKEYVSLEKVYTKAEVQKRLSINFQKFCEDLEGKGKKILTKDIRVSFEKTSGRAKGTLRIQENLGEHIKHVNNF